MYFKFAAKELAISALMLGACVSAADAKTASSEKLNTFKEALEKAQGTFNTSLSDTTNGCEKDTKETISKIEEVINKMLETKKDAIKDTTNKFLEEIDHAAEEVKKTAEAMTKFDEKRKENYKRSPFKFEESDLKSSADSLKTDLTGHMTKLEDKWKGLAAIFDGNFTSKIGGIFLSSKGTSSGATTTSSGSLESIVKLAEASNEVSSRVETAMNELIKARDEFKDSAHQAFETVVNDNSLLSEDHSKVREAYEKAMFERSKQYDKLHDDLFKLNAENGKKLVEVQKKVMDNVRGAERAQTSYTGAIDLVTSFFKMTAKTIDSLSKDSSAMYMINHSKDFSTKVGDMKKTLNDVATFLANEISLKSSSSGSSSGGTSTDTNKPDTKTETSETSTMTKVLIGLGILAAILLLGGIIYYFMAK